MYGVEQLVISILKRAIRMRPLNGFEEEIEALEDNPYERQLIKELCLKEWLHRLKANNSQSKTRYKAIH